MCQVQYCIPFVKYDELLTDGEPGDSVRLHADGPCIARGAQLHPGHCEEDQESRLQCSPHPKIHPQVTQLFSSSPPPSKTAPLLHLKEKRK